METFTRWIYNACDHFHEASHQIKVGMYCIERARRMERNLGERRKIGNDLQALATRYNELRRDVARLESKYKINGHFTISEPRNGELLEYQNPLEEMDNVEF